MNLPYKALISLTILSSSCGVFGLFSQLFYSFRADEETYFELYTPQSPTEPQIFNLKNLSSLTASDKFDPSLEMRLMIHGLFENMTRASILREKLSATGPMNIVTVIWSKGSSLLFGGINSREAGHAVGKFLADLERRFSVDMSRVTIIGEGWGASVAGEAGSRLGNLSTIIALDPSHNIVSRPLQRSDAQVVQAIHSGVFYGRIGRSGDADFKLNKGFWQPGCGYSPKCNHLYAGNVYILSLSGKTFTGCRIGHETDCGYKLGGDPVQVYQGVFRVETSKDLIKEFL